MASARGPPCRIQRCQLLATDTPTRSSQSWTDFIIAPLPFIRLKPGTSPREVSDWSIVQLQLGSCLVIYSLAQAEAFDRRQVMNCNRRVPRRSNSILLEAFEQTIDRLAADADHHR